MIAAIIVKTAPSLNPNKRPPITEKIPGGNRKIGRIDANNKNIIGAQLPNCSIKFCIFSPLTINVFSGFPIQIV